jgi:hypothetical protein
MWHVWAEEEKTQGSGGETSKKRPLKDAGAQGRKIVKWILKK